MSTTTITRNGNTYATIRDDAKQLHDTLKKNTPMNLVIVAHGDMDQIPVFNHNNNTAVSRIGDNINDYISQYFSKTQNLP